MRHILPFIRLMTGIAICGAVSAIANPALGAAEDPSCAPQGNIRFVCGRGGPEDIAPLVGTEWAISGAYTGAIGLHLVNVRNADEVAILYPAPNAIKKHDKGTYGSCPGPLTAAGDSIFIAHGLSIKKVNDRSYTLYVVHHGERESIEVFNLEVANGQRPAATWIGCAVAPGNAIFNSVVPLPDGGFVATRPREKRDGWKPVTHFDTIFGDPISGATSPEFEKRTAAGENTGDVQEWQPKTGWMKVPGSEVPHPNGIEVSRDGKQLYIVTGRSKLMRLSRGANPPKKDIVDFAISGDNVKWSADGNKLLVAGGVPRESDGVVIGRIGRVVAIDPNTLAVSPVADVPGPIQTAIGIGNDLWMASVQGLRLLVMPMPSVK